MTMSLPAIQPTRVPASQSMPTCEHQAPEPAPASGEGATAVAAPPKPAPAKPTPAMLPQYRVLLHDDPISEMGFVVETLVQLTPLDKVSASRVMREAHRRGVSLVLVTHKERAELYQEQFASKRLKVTIEPFV